MLDPRERLIVALDVSSVAEAEAMVARLGEAVVFYKIGYQLGFAGGLDFARALTDTGKQVFIDMKLHDIGNTVAQGVKSVARMGATFLTVHAYPQTMHAAVDARAGSKLRILAVTVLTSYDDADLAAAGYDFTVPELVAERAAQARDVGVDGLVCSAEEAANIRSIVGPAMALVTPGIRPAGADAGDQKRIMTPAAAIAAGADYLVVGRPVVAAPDPKAAAEAIVAEIAAAARSVIVAQAFARCSTLLQDGSQALACQLSILRYICRSKALLIVKRSAGEVRRVSGGRARDRDCELAQCPAIADSGDNGRDRPDMALDGAATGGSLWSSHDANSASKCAQHARRLSISSLPFEGLADGAAAIRRNPHFL